VKRGVDPHDEPSEAGLLATQHLMKAFSTYQFRAKHFDQALVMRHFDAIAHDIIWLDEQNPCLAVSSLFSLDQLWDEADEDIVRVILNVFPLDERRSVAIFSYANEQQGKSRGALSRIFSAEGALQRYEISKLILGSVENFILSPRHFHTWSPSKRKTILKAFATTILVSAPIAEHPDLMLF
jgi:hypothetical protein